MHGHTAKLAPANVAARCPQDVYSRLGAMVMRNANITASALDGATLRPLLGLDEILTNHVSKQVSALTARSPDCVHNKRSNFTQP
jgi:hypothetical protein